MGEARRRGTFEERKAEAIAAGRIKKNASTKRFDMISRLKTVHSLFMRNLIASSVINNRKRNKE